MALYSEWQTKLNFTALDIFQTHQKCFLQLAHHITMLIVLISIVCIRIYKTKIHSILPIQSSIGTLKKVLVLPLLLGILLLVRGGFQPIPVNLSDAYFSNKIILNDIAVNPNWNILQSILKNKTNFEGNPYKKHSRKSRTIYE